MIKCLLMNQISSYVEIIALEFNVDVEENMKRHPRVNIRALEVALL